MLVVILLFFIIANPALFKMTRALGGWVASPEGCPKAGGLLLHAVVFAVVTRFIMKSLRRRKMRKYYSQYEEDYEEEYEEDYEEPEAFEEFKEEEYSVCPDGKHRGRHGYCTY